MTGVGKEPATAVWFDCDGTLLAFDRPYEAVVRAAFERACGRSDPAWTDTYEAAFAAAFGAAAPDPYRRGMTAVRERHGVDPDADALVAALVEAECEAVSPRPGVVALLDAVVADHRCGVLTNGVDRVQREKLAHHGLLGRVDAVVASCGVGAHKPATAAFDAARDALDAEAHVMIGDDAEADVAGARAAGFRAIHVDDGDGAGPRATTTLDALVVLVGPQ